jgi:hypothetical protein
MHPKQTEELMRKPNHVFVFGSNLAGIHGAGAAKTAVDQYGAIRGCGKGFQGRCYAIPTKDKNIRTLPLYDIEKHVEQFLKYANSHPELTFVLTAIGCGLAGYSPSEIGPLFKHSPKNVVIPNQFIEFVDRDQENLA